MPVAILEGTAARHPDLEAPLAMLRATALGFVAYDATATAPPTPNLTITTTGDAIPVSSLLDALARQTADQLAKTQSVSDVQHSSETLTAGPAAELRYRLKPRNGGPEVAVDAWFVSTAGHTFVLTYTVPVAAGDAMRAAIRASADSLAGF